MSGPPEQHSPFAGGFMDDYFAEADEHLVDVRRELLRLEEALGGDLPPAIVDELFRSFHSLKGISAMVELREAELVAHHMESCLRAIGAGDFILTAAAFQTLVEGAHLLEQVIAARRADEPLPAITHALEALTALDSPRGLDTARRDGMETAAAGPRAPHHDANPAARTWKVTFVPSPELVQRGMKVDVVRSRLLQIGDIVSVVPRVAEGGGISFEFHVRTEDEAQLSAWRDDGVLYEAVAPAGHGAVSGEGPRDPGRPSSLTHRLPEAGAPVSTHFVRVDLARLDELMRIVGDLVVSRARLDATLQRVEPGASSGDWRALQEHSETIERHVRDIREAVMRVRLVPVGEIFRRMPFVVRDLARDTGKRVRLDLVGQSTEIDKFLIERMMDPVLHLVRNAISHGIETPDARIAAGKPPEGTIRLSADTSGESVLIQISDDGRGIDVEAVTERARSAGLVLEGRPDGGQLLDIISAPGFSTRDHADRASGRGIGMAVARTTIQELGGSIDLESSRGQGTTFTVTLPLTLTITEAIITQVGFHTFAVPQSSVREVIEVDRRDLRAIEHNELLPYRGGTLPMVRLSTLFGIPADSGDRSHGLVIGAGPGTVGFLVDRIAGHQEIVVKTITDPLIRVDGVSGATELGDGRLVLILDVISLCRGFRERSRSRRKVPA